MQRRFTSVGGVPLAPEVLIKGGTMSSRQEKLIHDQEEDANRRRAVQDQQQQIASLQHGPGSVASLRSRKLITQDSPRLVLYYKKYNQDCLSEITMVASEGGGLEPMFTLVCARCLERGVPQGQAQLQVRNSNRRFSLDERKRGPTTVVTQGIQQVVQQCGTVTVEERIQCGACGWTVKVTDSIVEEV